MSQNVILISILLVSDFRSLIEGRAIYSKGCSPNLFTTVTQRSTLSVIRWMINKNWMITILWGYYKCLSNQMKCSHITITFLSRCLRIFGPISLSYCWNIIMVFIANFLTVDESF